MASLFLIPLFTINHPSLVFCPSWSLNAFPGHRRRATNKAMLSASETVQQDLGSYSQTSREGNERVLWKSESKYWSFCDHILSSTTNAALPRGCGTHHVQPCLLDRECFSMMAVRRSSEKRWSRFSWPAVWLLMWGDAVDGRGWWESWKLFHRSRLYQKDHQKSSHKADVLSANTRCH